MWVWVSESVSIYGVAKCQIAWTQSTLSVPDLEGELLNSLLFLDDDDAALIKIC